MKKLAISLIIVAICSVSYGILEEIRKPVIIVKDKITVDEETGSTTTENKVADYVDEKTVKVTTTIAVTPAARAVEHDKAVLQTELDHMPDRIAKIQEQMDEAIARRDELILILGVFE